MKLLAVRMMHGSAAIVLALVPIAAAAKSASSLNNLIGSRAAGAESEMQARDWVMIDGHKGRDASYAYWWNSNRKDCVMVTTRDGRYSAITDASASDCNQKSSGGNDAAAVGAVAGVAALAVILLSHKSGHHDDGKHSDDSQNEADYERGYRDGLHNSAYRNNGNSGGYSSGYQNGVEQRQRELAETNSNYGGNGGYDNNARNDAGYGNGGGTVDVSDLVGAKAAGVETDLTSRGFLNVDGFESGNDKGTIWWNGRTRQCLQMITANGRADSINDIQTHPRCR